eukprot:gnl/TRDRNA2_/TRDRNA2_202404_c0_seq1.p1 gnl/TRDRNA2_/TRDRNA2_202404_c0~~gnl/TRDRNA2_/TRDRNA2_202404_c0_seq1.p1  ORF type:complete len:154 (+),score=19.43 gnl/TRDRNA2_/TRDRNA2_202404_c0_seq1:156-617(+)
MSLVNLSVLLFLKVLAEVDEVAIEAEIERLLAQRRTGATICPSDAARALATDWRPLMEPVRTVAARMAHEGRLVITQRGKAVDPDHLSGAIRLGKPGSTQPQSLQIRTPPPDLFARSFESMYLPTAVICTIAVCRAAVGTMRTYDGAPALCGT